MIVVEGPKALPAIGCCFQPASGQPVARLSMGRIVFGHWRGDTGEEVVVCRRGNERVEINCHGGQAAARAILSDLAEYGCGEIDWQAWVAAYETSPVRVAARIALAHARTERTAAILLDQYAGALEAELQNIDAAVGAGQAGEAAARIDRLLALGPLGLHLTEPWRVVLAGRPNVGKSSLINALAGFRRAIVSHEPGTTRDVVTVATAMEGWPVELADTAGLREASEELESAGIELARGRVAAADLVLLVCDLSLPWSSADDELHRALQNGLLVHNKADLSGGPVDDRPPGLVTSALTGEGIAELVQAIALRLVPSPPAGGAAVPFRPEHLAALESARVAVISGQAPLVVPGAVVSTSRQ
jgi:tRNA modification GTPase